LYSLPPSSNAQLATRLAMRPIVAPKYVCSGLAQYCVASSQPRITSRGAPLLSFTTTCVAVAPYAIIVTVTEPALFVSTTGSNADLGCVVQLKKLGGGGGGPCADTAAYEAAVARRRRVRCIVADLRRPPRTLVFSLVVRFLVARKQRGAPFCRNVATPQPKQHDEY